MKTGRWALLLVVTGCSSLFGSDQPECEKNTGWVGGTSGGNTVTECHRLDNGARIDCDMCKVVRST